MFVAVLLLLAAIGIEVVSTVLLPRTDGFTDPLWSAVVVVGYGISIWLLALVVRTLSVSTAYAVWSGLGTALVAIVGYLWLDEQMTLLKAASLALIVVGVVGLNLTATH